ncbi:hypothetical protein [Sinomonas sp. ASV322]|uniref:hypothetical protein n=1 Tax=Sinomonas sp. ASV322 TaxID=3041920 RepID=UPI0027DCE017|nr:hypothetical protein [Sinomonas sp. ASV322]MDQ4501277.1 hypothetical protein [Sinomonas sp. ASV322]
MSLVDLPPPAVADDVAWPEGERAARCLERSREHAGEAAGLLNLADALTRAARARREVPDAVALEELRERARGHLATADQWRRLSCLAAQFEVAVD